MSTDETTLKGLEKFLDLIKSSGWQTAAAAVAFGGLWWLVKSKVLPPFEPTWIIHVVVLGFLLSVALTLAAVLSELTKPLGVWTRRHLAKRELVMSAENAVPFMTKEERAIIGYLLHHKRKVFEGDLDGGYAASLMGRGFVTILSRRGQMLDYEQVPMTIPEPMWEVWERHKDKFPHKPVMNDGHEVHPWRIS